MFFNDFERKPERTASCWLPNHIHLSQWPSLETSIEKMGFMNSNFSHTYLTFRPIVIRIGACRICLGAQSRPGQDFPGSLGWSARNPRTLLPHFLFAYHNERSWKNLAYYAFYFRFQSRFSLFALLSTFLKFKFSISNIWCIFTFDVFQLNRITKNLAFPIPRNPYNPGVGYSWVGPGWALFTRSARGTQTPAWALCPGRSGVGPPCKKWALSKPTPGTSRKRCPM